MNPDDYEKECLSQLENTDFCEELQSDPNPDYRIEIDRVIDDLKHHDFITEFESQKMKEGNHTLCFYGLPKTDKQYSTFPLYALFAVDTTPVLSKLKNSLMTILNQLHLRKWPIWTLNPYILTLITKRVHDCILENDPFERWIPLS